MQCTQLISRRPFVFGGISLFLIWLFFGVDHQAIRDRVQKWNISSGAMSVKEADVFDFPPVDSQAMRDMCSSVEWNSSLIFTCDNNHGGIGHIRNSILNCVRYAIGAGGSLVLPSIAPRGHDELDDAPHVERRHGMPRQGIEYMFDKNHFADSLRKSCPELVLIRHMEPVETPRRRGLLPESLFPDIPITGLKQPEEWPIRLKAWIESYMSKENQKEPIIIDLEQSFLHYPINSDGHDVAHTFGNILKFRPDTRRLATRTLMKLSNWYDLPMNLSEPIINPSFFGAHLETASPFTQSKRHSDVKYSHYEAQSTAYLKQAFSAKTQIMYIASGDLGEAHKIGLEATEYNIAVTHKEDLLKEEDADELERLNWDQRALVDYLVLTKSQEFAGVGHSSFSWNIALKRHEEIDPISGTLEEHTETWSDGLSTLYGVRKSYVQSSGCMWA
ncbi:uncharacterized protein LY89DRAFT_662702 [Mollisia scopiformis]|uniref:Alternative oxidase n=1 Tax=Mollisia scopiformis TaxID=149040 RepID=A0A194XUV9_MOLSC|nr:uncharacterized protein LY89DRAFT_662702 [Mollisia scopiformis]KUJ23921.1 hypothetical protein LY89DRAFT_662702 [Mollisia scopiformis]